MPLKATVKSTRSPSLARQSVQAGPPLTLAEMVRVRAVCASAGGAAARVRAVISLFAGAVQIGGHEFKRGQGGDVAGMRHAAGQPKDFTAGGGA